MNKNIRRSIAALCAAVTVAMPLSSAPAFSGISSNTVSAEAASYCFLSGSTNYEFNYTDKKENYRLYFDVLDSSAKTAAVIGCCTYHTGTNITIPLTAKFRGVEYRITEIDDGAFARQKNIRYVNITENVKKIGDSAFRDCSEIGCVYWNDTLTDIGDRAFMNCSGIKSPYAFNFYNVKTVGEYAFKNCTGIHSIWFKKLSSLGEGAFENCYALKEVLLSSPYLTEIPDYAFRNAGSTVEDGAYVISSSVTKIGDQAFYKVGNIKEIDISGVSYIGDSAFEDCHRLEKAVTGDNLHHIGDRAFYGNDYMKYFVFAPRYGYIGEEALGFDHMKHYTGPKKDFTIYVLTGKHGGLRTNDALFYAIANDIDFDDIDNAPAGYYKGIYE